MVVMIQSWFLRNARLAVPIITDSEETDESLTEEYFTGFMENPWRKEGCLRRMQRLIQSLFVGFLKGSQSFIQVQGWPDSIGSSPRLQEMSSIFNKTIFWIGKVTIPLPYNSLQFVHDKQSGGHQPPQYQCDVRKNMWRDLLGLNGPFSLASHVP